jgi:hypothetical protein
MDFVESSSAPTTEEKKPEVKLVDVVITDENIALNVLVSFLSLAQRRGAFGMEESAKIWECVQKFQKKP